MAALTFDQAFQAAMQCFHGARFAEAEALCRNLLAAVPDDPEVLHLLGMVMGQTGRMQVAVDFVQRAIAVAPSVAHYHSNLATLLAALGRFDEAAAACEAACRLQPDFAQAFYNLGNVRMEQHRLDDSVTAFRTAVRLDPHHANAWANLGSVLHDRGEVASAMECYRRSLSIDPSHCGNRSSLLFAANYDPDCDLQTLLQYHREWDQRHAEPLRPREPSNGHEASPQRRLRIGYVSQDFRQHPVGRHVLVLFREHDRQQFEPVAYSGVRCPDSVTEQTRSLAGLWRETAQWSDAQLAAQIRADAIDILVDLSLHSSGHRLLTFARKPAPVQVSFGGYPGTTGLSAIDYRLTDSFLDPVDRPSLPSVEEPVRLPDSFWCFDPFEEAPAVGPLPALIHRGVTFGSLNNFSKVHAGVISLWARVLTSVPDSRFLMLSPEGECRDRVIRQFGSHGIERDRVGFVGRADRATYFAYHHQLDVILDTFPYNGHSTTCEALWMGVPVVSLAGATPVARGGLSILSTAGLPELVAQTAEEYVTIARDLVRDLPRLEAMRGTLRERMRRSPLMDAPRFTRNVEAAFREMWQRWCAAF